MLSGAALLSFVARAFVDFRFVYAELGLDAGALGFAILFHLVVLGGWIWAIVAASHGRRAMYVLLSYAILVVMWGAYTLRALCPSPCRTGWPVGEIAIWSNVVIGLPAAVVAAIVLFRRTRVA
jgi:hypothetical protein